MRRNLISFLKFLLLSLCVVLLTIFVFKIVRPFTISENKNYNDDYNNVVHLPFRNFNSKKIDWHDYKKIQRDKEQSGIGEHGKPAHLSSSEKDLQESLYKVNGFNAALSDKISLHRSIPDIRHPGCQKKNYSSSLPTVSVVVPFHDEHWSTLLRTAHSVVDRSPPQLLKEIILVDDFSTKEFLKNKLDDYVNANFSNVHVVRLPSRQGLILARLAGAKIATGDVLLFLDSHTEANVNWLPPLLEPIAENYKTCVCPFIDVIAHETFEYRAQDEGARGAFDWEFFYKRLPLLEEDKKRPTEPFKSPIMAGGLFAIAAKWFWELGGYDEGLDIWGGEQYELSFKIWQCGGTMFDAPCSRVGHIYRKFAPFPNPGRGDFVGKNYKRVAEVWMDEYKEYIYKRKPHYRNIDPGDLTAQKNIRTKLNCKPFKWFMKEIAFDLPKKYPPVEPEDFASGEIQSVFAPELCVDTKKYGGDKRFGVELCVSDKSNSDSSYSHEQQFNLGWHRDIRPKGRNMCWDVADPNDKAALNLFSCHGYGGNQLWRYRPEKKWLVHGGNPRCLDLDPVKRLIFLTKCDEKSETQRWKITKVNEKQLKYWDDPLKLLDLPM